MIRIHQRLAVRISLALTFVALPALGAVAWWIADGEAAEIEDLTVQKGRVAAMAGARAYQTVLENGIATGELKLNDLLNPTYEKIDFPGIKPPEDPRFHTKFDAYTDSHGIQGIEDQILASSPEFSYASGIDRYGYVPTPHKKFDEPPTGDPAHDRQVSRQKRKYNGEQLQAAKFISSDHEPTLVLPYTRDTGEMALDVAATIFVQGHPFGAFRVGVLRDGIIARQRVRIASLTGAFGVLALAMTTFIFLMLYRSIRPLENLAGRANMISMGEGTNEPIRSDRTDEIGQMAKSVNRLRASLAAAMKRLGE